MGAKQIEPLSHRRELLVVLAMTAIGGLIRVWSPARLGLVHFDEGIYALAALWPLNPKGFWGIDPTVIAYAPGGYPFLVGLASFGLGIGDLTPILVSSLMGTLTIPVAAWLSWRTFGPTAGAVSATLSAFSGFHIAFSRMGLTDASFLLFFLLALGLGQRFLERPNLLNTIGLGIGVGLAQWFKYHGWLVGAIVILTAVVNAIRDPEERKPRRLAAVWGQGVCAALLAFVVFWPWFSFVESQGGYTSLLKHHASYMQGAGAWLTNLGTQLDQQLALENGHLYGPGSVGIVICVVMYFLCDDWKTSKPLKDRVKAWGNIGTFLIPFLIAPWAWWWIFLLVLPWFLGRETVRGVVIAICWLIFAVMTPLYHPYARLWMPLEACEWLFLGWLGSVYVKNAEKPLNWRPILDPPSPEVSGILTCWLLHWSIVFILFIFWWQFPVFDSPATSLITPSDSLRVACRQVQADLPKNLTRLRFLGRPTITFYLATAGVPLATQPDLDSLLKSGAGGELALVDDALLRQEGDYSKAKGRLTEDWEIVKEYPSQLNLPTLLDLNPGAARERIEASEFQCPLWLLRPRSKGSH